MNRHLEQWLNETRPRWLDPATPPPESWGGDEAEWEEIRAAALLTWEQRAVFMFGQKVGVDGYRPGELARGSLDKGREVSGVSGRVITKMPPVRYSEDAVRRALAVRADAQRLVMTLDATLSTSVDAIVEGREQGRGWEVRLAAAEALVRAREEEKKAAQRHRFDNTVEVTFFAPTEALGRHWERGRQRVSRTRIDELVRWRETMEVQARRSGRDLPDERRYPVWPPFTVKEEAVAT